MSEQTNSPTEDNELVSMAERRASVRYECVLNASCSSMLELERTEAVVQDVSSGGVGLLMNRDFDPGTYLIVELESRKRHTLLTFIVRVIHSRLQTHGSWIIGCQFVTQPTDDQIQALL